MDALISSLPNTTDGLLWAFDDLTTDNKITSEQVATANVKGWKVLTHGTEGPEDYTGVVDGDANGDKQVDVADIVAIISHKKGTAVAGFSLFGADVNSDGNADEQDIELIKKIIMGE